MSEGTGKKRRRAYLNDFKKVGDSYRWQGAGYRFAGDKVLYRRFLIRLWTAAAVLGITAVAAGCIPAAGMDQSFYLLLPYMVQLVAAISVVWTLIRMSRAGSCMRTYIYEETVHKITFRGRLTEVAALVVLAAEAFFVLRNGIQDRAPATLLFAAVELMAVAGGHCLCRILGRMNWERVENVE